MYIPCAKVQKHFTNIYNWSYIYPSRDFPRAWHRSTLGYTLSYIWLCRGGLSSLPAKGQIATKHCPERRWKAIENVNSFRKVRHIFTTREVTWHSLQSDLPFFYFYFLNFSKCFFPFSFFSLKTSNSQKEEKEKWTVSDQTNL